MDDELRPEYDLAELQGGVKGKYVDYGRAKGDRTSNTANNTNK